MIRISRRPLGLLLLVGTFTLLANRAPAQTTDRTPDAEARLRGLLKLKLGFPRYVIDNAAFPQPAFDDAAAAEKLLGPYTIKTTYFGPDYHEVSMAKQLGPYAAIVAVVPKTGRGVRRYFALYRIGKKVDPNWRTDPAHPMELAETMGLNPAVVAGQAELIATTLKDRPFAQFATDPRAARLFAGLHLGKVLDHPPDKSADAFAQERQWWVTLRRRRNGMDKVYPKPFVCPVVTAQESPVVRAGTAAEAGVKPDTAAKLDSVCRTWAADDDQAFAVCVVRHGIIVLHKAYGTRDGKPMTVDTKSWMASITKAMSATLMMELVDQGLVKLDDPVAKYVPALRGIKSDRPVTIRHLYTHTSGLAKWPYWDEELHDVEERAAEYYPFLQVGKEWAYTGAGYTLAGKVIENVSGEAIPQLFRRHLLGPLGCDHTDVIGTQADALSTPLDMAKLGQVLLNRGGYGRMRFFRPETFEQMLPRKLDDLLGPGAKRTFGIGLDGTPQQFGHGAASAATFSVSAADDLVVIMTRNRMGKNQDKYNGKFWDALRAGPVK